MNRKAGETEVQRPAFDYLNPDVPDHLPVFEVPLVVADETTVAPFGRIVTDPETHPVEIVPWPASGWRPIDAGTGDQGGYAEGVFLFRWQGNMLFAENTAVDDRYLLGWSEQPGDARTDNSSSNRNRLLIWHANYHPDGGQLFYPLTRTPFVVALAPPGDDVRPEDWVALWCDGSFGICIDPGVWHEAVAPSAEAAEFLDKQGRVHDIERYDAECMVDEMSENECEQDQATGQSQPVTHGSSQLPPPPIERTPYTLFRFDRAGRAGIKPGSSRKCQWDR